MNPLALFLLALSLSADAFAVAIGKGIVLHHVPPREAVRTGAIFGLVEALNLVLGWAVGTLAGRFVQAVDHWLAFAILGALGIKMILEGRGNECAPKPQQTRHGFLSLALAAVGSSIDSMGVGVSLAFIDQSIITAGLAVGFATFTMASLGVAFGPFLGCKIGKRAEALGGLVLIAIGTLILLEHTGIL